MDKEKSSKNSKNSKDSTVSKNRSNSLRSRLIAAAVACGLVMVLAAVALFSCNGCITSKKNMLISHAWICGKDESLQEYTVLKFNKDGIMQAIKKYVDDGDKYKLSEKTTWKISGDKLSVKNENATQEYNFKRLNEAELKAGVCNAESDEWYVSNDYLSIGTTVFVPMSDEEYEFELNKAHESIKKNYEDLVDDFDTLYE